VNISLRKSEICGEVKVPPSKSAAHRMMIAAALSGARLNVENAGKDIEATARCLDRIMDFKNKAEQGNGVFVGRNEKPAEQNGEPFETNGEFAEQIGEPILRNKKTVELNVGESGSTLRCLIPVVSALGIPCRFSGEGRLGERPIGELISALEERGAEFGKEGEGNLPLAVCGKLRAGDFHILATVSSQYISGLLFALPLLDGDSRIILDGEPVSKDYIEITLAVLKSFGIKIEKTEYGFFVCGNQKYILPSSLEVEGDWSSAAFLLALGALSGKTKILGLNLNSTQGDKTVLTLLKKSGAKMTLGKDFVICEKSELRAIDFDAQNCPDIVPVMAAVLSFAKGNSRISHVERLKAKESDRLHATIDVLHRFGIEARADGDSLIIIGGEHKPAVVNSFGDHRMAMSATVIALATDGESVIENIECISKSYPDFVNDARNMGADISYIE